MCEKNCVIKPKCVVRVHEYIIRQLDEFSFYSKVECNENKHINCINVAEKCEKFCPIDCLREEYFFTSKTSFHEEIYQKVHYYF
jgi:hypothetical protein